MLADTENKCCKQKCLSKTNVFVNTCISKENPETAINLSDTYVHKSMQHTAYCQ